MVTIQAFPVIGVVNPIFSAMPLSCVIICNSIERWLWSLKNGINYWS